MKTLLAADSFSLVCTLEISGLTPVDRLDALLRSGLDAGEAFDLVLPRMPSVLHRATLLATALQRGVDTASVALACRRHGVHPLSVGVQVPEAAQRVRIAQILGATEKEADWINPEDGAIHLNTDNLRAVPEGLASSARVWIAGLPKLRLIATIPDAPWVTIQDTAVSRLDLSGQSVRVLTINNCPLLREITLPAATSVTITNCPSLQRVRLLGPIQQNLKIQGCGWLEEIQAKGSIEGNLELLHLPRLRRWRGPLQVGGDLRMEWLHALRSIPAGFKCGGEFFGKRLQSLNRIGIPAGPMVSFQLSQGAVLKTLPRGFVVLKSLELEDLECLRTIPGEVMVGTRLRIADCNSLRTFGKGFQAPSRLSLKNCPSLIALPDRETPFDSLELNALPLLTALPENYKVKGRLTYEGCAQAAEALMAMQPER